MDAERTRRAALLRVAGGCEDCPAWSELVDHGGVLRVEVSHDPTCPDVARLARRRWQP